MIRQVNYIIYAVLILSIAGTALHFIKKIPSELIVEKEEGRFCGTDDRVSRNLSFAALDGKKLFLSKCASCHNVFRDGAGPALGGFEERGLWADQNKLHEWIKDPAAFMKKDIYTRKLKEKYRSMMTAFPDITKEEVNAIAQYINEDNSNRLPIP